MKLSEFEIIERIHINLPPIHPDVVQGIGDDCAVIDKKNGTYQLITTDCLVSKVHFDLEYFTPFEVGKKAMSVNLSDIAAMGGNPLYAVVTVGVPKDFDKNWILNLYDGLNQASQEFNVSIIGGDISKTVDDLMINVTLVGEVPVDSCKFRKGAMVGDSIYVSGPIGSSALGLAMLKKKKNSPLNTFIRAHKTPQAQITLGQFIANSKGTTAMIDISDGLLGDLKHVLKASEVGATISLDKIPYDQDFVEETARFELSVTQLLLGGGEDYQLLFTINPQSEELFLDRARKSGHRIAKIGHITEASEGLKICDEKGMEIQIQNSWQGFDHFA